MFIAVDVGNTNIIYGVMDEDSIRFSSRLATDTRRTADEYAVIFRDLLHIHGISKEEIEGGIISSVVPSMKKVMQDAVLYFTGKKCMIVGPGVKSGLRIRIDNPAQLGSDQVCNAVAVRNDYQKAAIIIDMNTATTVSVLNDAGEYIGGLIMPGPRVGMEALTAHASLLPHISLDDYTDDIIGTNTEDCMGNGLVYGNAAMIDGLIDRISARLGEEPVTVATGSAAKTIIRLCSHSIVYDENLLLRGMRCIYMKNRRHHDRH